MNQNPEQPQQNNYTQYPQYDPTQAAPPPYDPTQAAPPAYPGNPGYPSPSYPPPSTAGSGVPDYMSQSPYSPQSPYPQPAPYPPSSGQSNSSGMYPPSDPYAPPVSTPQYPGYPPVPKKNRTWLWITLGVVGVLLVALIASCAIFSNAMTKLVSSSSTDATSTATTSNTNTGGQNVTGGDSGQVRTLQNVDCTMSQVKIIPGDDYAKPKAGTQFVQIHVKIVNRSSEKQHYNPLDFKLLTSDGKSTAHSYIVPAGYETQLSFGDLNPGQSIEGNLIFEVPINDHGAMINWDPVFNDFAENPGKAQWKLGL